MSKLSQPFHFNQSENEYIILPWLNLKIWCWVDITCIWSNFDQLLQVTEEQVMQIKEKSQQAECSQLHERGVWKIGVSVQGSYNQKKIFLKIFFIWPGNKTALILSQVNFVMQLVDPISSQSFHHKTTIWKYYQIQPYLFLVLPFDQRNMNAQFHWNLCISI